MAKKRTIDIDALLFDSELIETLTLKGILFYVMLWGHAEDWGGLELKITDLKLRMGAIGMTSKEITKELDKLTNITKKIVPYNQNGRQYGWIKNFLKHQRLNNPAPPILPLPEWITFELQTYPSGKKWAKYAVITEKIPVDYQYTTSKCETKPIETETSRNGNLKETTYCTTSVVREAASYFYASYKKAFSKDYVASPAKEGAILKGLTAVIPIDELKSLIDAFFASSDKFILDSSYSIGVFKSQINKLRIPKKEEIRYE